LFRPFTGRPRSRFDRKVLRKNDISLLILDERWNGLFADTPKSLEVIYYEKALKELIKEDARINAESKEIQAIKKCCMDRIIRLTPEVFEKNNENARREMKACEAEIKRINGRMKKIEQELDEMPGRIREINLKLLEHTVNLVYLRIRKSQKRVRELEELIERTRLKLKEYIDEKEKLSQGDTDIYSYFHDLLGAEELERLDNEFFRR